MIISLDYNSIIVYGLVPALDESLFCRYVCIYYTHILMTAIIIITNVLYTTVYARRNDHRYRGRGIL